MKSFPLDHSLATSTLQRQTKVFHLSEGIQHKSKPIFATQFHPEASGGPTDTAFLFERFIDMIKTNIMTKPS